MDDTFLISVPRLHAALARRPEGCLTLWPGLPRMPEGAWAPALPLSAGMASACLADYERACRDGASGAPVHALGAEHAPSDLSDAERRALREMAGMPAEEPEQPLRLNAQQVLLLTWLQERQALELAELEQKISATRRKLAGLLSGRTRVGDIEALPSDNDLPDWRKALAAVLAFLPDMPASPTFHVSSAAMAASAAELPSEPAEMLGLPEGFRAVSLPASSLASLCGRSACERLRRELGARWDEPVILCLPEDR